MELGVIEEKIKNLERRIRDLEEDDKKLQDKMNTYDTNQATIMEQLHHINEKLDDLAKRQDEFFKSPKPADVINKEKASNWNKIVGTAITTIVGALVGALIALILK